MTSFLQFDAGTGVKLSDAFVVALYHVVFWTCADYWPESPRAVCEGGHVAPGHTCEWDSESRLQVSVHVTYEVCMYLQSALCVCIHASMHDTWTTDMGYLFWSRKLIRRVSWVLGSLCVCPFPSLCVYLCVNDSVETLNCVELMPVANW